MDRLSQPGQIRGIPLGRYVLGPRVAIGGMGEVYLAVQLGLGRVQKPIALKLLLPHLSDSPQAIQMFLDEAQLAARMNHPNVIQIYDVGTAEGRYYIAMELVRGVSMSSFIHTLKESRKRASGAMLAYIGRALCDGLHHAHEQVDPDGRRLEVVHRDVTPHNVLLSVDGEVKLTDFGIAKARDSATHTRPGYVKGKFEYVAPEQLLGKPLDRRVDIFGAGLTLYHLATLNSPFRRENELATLHAVERDPLPSLSMLRSDLPQSIRDAITRATQKDPRERFATARAFRDALPPAGPEGREQLAALVRELCKDAVEKLENKTARAKSLEGGTVGTGSGGTEALGTEALEERPAGAGAPGTAALEESAGPGQPYQRVTVALRPQDRPVSTISPAPRAPPAREEAEDERDELADVTFPASSLPDFLRSPEGATASPLPSAREDAEDERDELADITYPANSVPEFLAELKRATPPLHQAPSPSRPRGIDTDEAPITVPPPPPPRPPPPRLLPAEPSTDPAPPQNASPAPSRPLPPEPPSDPYGPGPDGAAEPEPVPEPQASNWRLAVIGGLLGVLAAVALGLWLFRGASRRAAAPPAPAHAAGQEAPAARSPAPPTPHPSLPKLDLPVLAAPADEEKTGNSAPETTPPNPDRVGYLTVEAIPWANVYVQERKLGRTPLAHYPIESGSVTVTLMNPETGRTVTKKVRVTSGKHAYLKEDLR